MHVHIIAVGRLKKGPELTLIQDYIKRCPWKITITEVEERRPIKGAERMSREADLILKEIPHNAHVIALDERGKSYRSTQFAHLLQDKFDQGFREIILLIGGADGYDQSVKERANQLLSLSSMTLPHMMARLILCEQIYRATTILSGHPYHKD